MNKIFLRNRFKLNLTGILLLCMFIPFMPHGCSITGKHKEHGEKSMPTKTIKPLKISITPEFWDFGKITEPKIVSYTFKVKNIGSEVLVIKQVFTNCGCTTASIAKNKLNPAESTELTVNFDPQGIRTQGRLKRDIYIESNDPKFPTKIVSITAELEITSLHLKTPPPPKMSSRDLYARLKKGENITILDVREENEYITRHIPNAIWFPKSKFDKQDPEVFKKLDKIDKKNLVVIYCGAGHRSNYVARRLREMGYDAYNLDGISFWEKENLPLVRGPKLPSSKEPAIIHLEEAYENYYLLFEDVIWIDVRNFEDYKQGHIKGALGIPLSEIDSRINEIPRDKEIVLYCEGTWDGGICEASHSAGRILIKHGFKQGNIKVFEDGYGAWEDAGYPIERKR